MVEKGFGLFSDLEIKLKEVEELKKQLKERYKDKNVIDEVLVDMVGGKISYIEAYERAMEPYRNKDVMSGSEFVKKYRKYMTQL